MVPGGGGRREPAWRPGSRRPLGSRVRLAAAARLVTGLGGAGECLDEPGRGPGAGEEGPLAVGAGAPLVEPAQQPGDGLGVAAVAERGVDMIQQAGPQAARVGGLPGERVDSCPGQPPPGRGGQGRVDPPGRRRWHWRPPAGLGQGGRDQGAGQPGHQHRGAGVEAGVGDPDLHRGVARRQPRQEVDALLIDRRAAPDEAADRRIVGGGVRPLRGRHRRRPA